MSWAAVREQRNLGRFSLRKLSEMAGISNPYLSQIERGLRRPSAEILQQIARTLEISSETLYVRAGILDEEGLEFDLVTAIHHDPHLTEEQKKTLVRVYESFRRENGNLNSAAVDVPNAAHTPVAPDSPTHRMRAESSPPKVQVWRGPAGRRDRPKIPAG